MLNRKEVVKEIPPYFKNHSVPIVSYSYTKCIGRKIFNYKEALQDIILEIMFPIDVLRFSEFRTMRNHLSETLMWNDIQITSDYMSRWVALKRRVGAVTSQRILKVLLILLMIYFLIYRNLLEFITFIPSYFHYL
jgi:hypothetical protein